MWLFSLCEQSALGETREALLGDYYVVEHRDAHQIARLITVWLLIMRNVARGIVGAARQIPGPVAENIQ